MKNEGNFFENYFLSGKLPLESLLFAIMPFLAYIKLIMFLPPCAQQ